MRRPIFLVHLSTDCPSFASVTFTSYNGDASEVVSFGDGQNDKSMIEWAGTGVAMGNAVDEVKAVAQMVTANNNEDGIAVALDKLLGYNRR